MYIDNLKFIQTCFACPEQYDVYKDNIKVGYIRLRHGALTCDFPDVTGEEIYKKYFDDRLDCFDSEKDRIHYLEIIANTINDKLN